MTPDKIILPASWASALCNGDWSGLEADPDDAAACRAWIAANPHVQIADMGEPSFSWSAGFYGSPYSGADVAEYTLAPRCCVGGEG